MIYFNHAATSWPKPEEVKNAYMEAMNGLPSGQFRSAGVSDNGEIFGTCRARLARLLGTGETDRIFFTSGSTESLNLLFAGLKVPASSIITTAAEHNSVLRPLYNLTQIKGEPVVLPCDERGLLDPALFEEAAKKGKARAIVVNHCSNVTGAVQAMASIGEIAKRYGLLFVVDASQSAGCLPVEADLWRADAVAFTGHKSLLGPQGTGGFYLRSGVPFVPAKFGGTGLDSRRIVYEDGDFELEVGTQNACGIAALSAAAELLLSIGVSRIREKEKELTGRLKEGFRAFPGLRLIDAGEDQGPVVSVQPLSLKPSDLAYILQNSYGIVTRAGLQCAPLIHEYLGTAPEGTLRISVGWSNTMEEIETFLGAMEEIL